MLNIKIKNLRKSFGISQVQLANELGVTKQCVSNWENDNIMPSVEMLVKISIYFNVSCDYLLGIENSNTIDYSGLTDTQLAHIKLLIKDLIVNN
jgi:transcriptional regulator with XRE-family HTH domain